MDRHWSLAQSQFCIRLVSESRQRAASPAQLIASYPALVGGPQRMSGSTVICSKLPGRMKEYQRSWLPHSNRPEGNRGEVTIAEATLTGRWHIALCDVRERRIRGRLLVAGHVTGPGRLMLTTVSRLRTLLQTTLLDTRHAKFMTG